MESIEHPQRSGLFHWKNPKKVPICISPVGRYKYLQNIFSNIIIIKLSIIIYKLKLIKEGSHIFKLTQFQMNHGRIMDHLPSPCDSPSSFKPRCYPNGTWWGIYINRSSPNSTTWFSTQLPRLTKTNCQGIVDQSNPSFAVKLEIDHS